MYNFASVMECLFHCLLAEYLPLALNVSKLGISDIVALQSIKDICLGRGWQFLSVSLVAM